MNFNLPKSGQHYAIGSILCTFLFSCEKDKEEVKYTNGAFVVNEGAYTGNNGTISFYSFDEDTVVNDIFFVKNSRALGDVVQSMTIDNGKAYIVVNNSNKVEIADAVTFKELGVIENVNSPRYFISDGIYG
jgi:hypothetical protein